MRTVRRFEIILIHKMKKTFTAIFTGFILFGCAGKSADNKALFDKIIKIHEKVMNADGQLMTNKMQLDMLLKRNDLPERDSALLLRTKLVAVDSAMDIWMNKFDPEFKGKSDEETANYLNDQKKQIETIDSQLNDAVSQSNKYLLKVKAK